MEALDIKLWEKSRNIYHCGRRRRRVQSRGGRKLMVNHTGAPPGGGPPEIQNQHLSEGLSGNKIIKSK